jgi:outer membrane translocation and assembly module TamA
VRDFNPLRVRKTAGVGLRFDLGFALGRLDLAFKLDRRPGESVTKVHFSLGQAFEAARMNGQGFRPGV